MLEVMAKTGKSLAGKERRDTEAEMGDVGGHGYM